MISISKTYTLQWPDGSAVTAQEVYDAFMSGAVRLEDAEGHSYFPQEFDWADANASQTDSTNVVYVQIITSSDTIIVGEYPGK